MPDASRSADAAEWISLAIEGMSCAACAARLERVLGRQRGVRAAHVSLTAERADILGASDQLALDELIETVERAGFRGRPVTEATPEENEQAEQPGPERMVFLVSALLSVPLALEMVPMALGQPHWLPGWAQLLLATPVQFWAGARFYRGAWSALRSGGANMDVLIALGTSAAYGLSAFRVIAGSHAPLHFEAAAVVITLVLLGKWLEARARRRTNRAVEGLLALRPDTARLRRDGVEVVVPIHEVQPGDLLMVRPGERIPADGVVLNGQSAVDESMLTGESVPQAREPGGSVSGGTAAVDGLLLIRATTLGSASTLGRMVALLRQAQASKPRIQRLADTVSGYFAFFVVAASGLTFAGWLLAGAPAGSALLPAIAVLVVACPCALGLATPTVVSVALGAAARNGILFRDAEALETAHRIDTVVFDKTGTLTEPLPVVATTDALGADPEALLGQVAAVQRGSNHPIARALVAEAEARGVPVPAASECRTVPGRGVRGRVAGRLLLLGNRAFMHETGVCLDDHMTRAAALEADGASIVWIATGSEDGPRLIGLVGVADRPRPTAATAVATLRAQGFAVIMLTGDARPAALATARRLGIDEVVAEASPHDKLSQLERLREAGRSVAMVGDGINDAAALARADLGLAMGEGTEIAFQAAAVGLMRPDPQLVADVIGVARTARRRIVENLVWAFGFNAIAIPLAALGVLSPPIAALGMSVSSLAVVTNALRLNRWRPAAAAWEPGPAGGKPRRTSRDRPAAVATGAAE